MQEFITYDKQFSFIARIRLGIIFILLVMVNVINYIMVHIERNTVGIAKRFSGGVCMRIPTYKYALIKAERALKHRSLRRVGSFKI